MESSNGIVLSRRAVIAMAPVGAIAAAGLAPGLAASPYDLGRDASADAGAIAMAYWAGSAALGPQQSWTLAQGRPTIAEPEERSTEAAEGRPQPVDLVPAESLAGGDPAFILYGARVAIHGLVAMKWTGEGRLPPIAIDVDYNPARAQRFSAWSLSQRDEGPSISGPIAIDVPVEPSAGLSLVFRVADKQAQRTKRLSIAPTGLGAKMRRGVYFIAWSDTARLPDWRSLRMLPEAQEEHGHAPRAYHLTGRGLDAAPASFAVIMLSLDYAAAPGSEAAQDMGA